MVARWLDDGVAPNGARGRAFGERGVHGFDLTFCAPKSVSLVRALRTDDVVAKAIADAHTTALSEAMEYLAAHAGYTRVHNPRTGEKDLVRLPGLVADRLSARDVALRGPASAHPRHRAESPSPRRWADGVDRWDVAVSRGPRRRGDLSSHAAPRTAPVDGFRVGAGRPVDRDGGAGRGGSRHHHRVVAALHPAARVGRPPSETSSTDRCRRRSWRPRRKPPARPNPKNSAWAQLLAAVARRCARSAAGPRSALTRRARRGAPPRAPRSTVRALAAAAEKIEKAAFTRADLVEIVGAQLPVDTEQSPRAAVEAAVDEIGMRLTAPRAAHEREGHERFTLDSHPGRRDGGARSGRRARRPRQLWVKDEDTAAAVARIRRARCRTSARSPWLVQPLSAPAGAGKTTSMRALRAAAHHRPTARVLVLAPTGKAVDVAMREGAGDDGMTIAKALQSLRDNTLQLDSRDAGRRRRSRHGRHRRPAPTPDRHHRGGRQDRAGG